MLTSSIESGFPGINIPNIDTLVGLAIVFAVWKPYKKPRLCYVSSLPSSLLSNLNILCTSSEKLYYINNASKRATVVLGFLPFQLGPA